MLKRERKSSSSLPLQALTWNLWLVLTVHHTALLLGLHVTILSFLPFSSSEFSGPCWTIHSQLPSLPSSFHSYFLHLHSRSPQSGVLEDCLGRLSFRRQKFNRRVIDDMDRQQHSRGSEESSGPQGRWRVHFCGSQRKGDNFTAEAGSWAVHDT